MDIELALMTGVDIPIEGLQLILHQPTIKEISMIGEKKFLSTIQVLCLDIKEQLEQEEVSNFQMIMRLLQEKQLKHIRENINICFDLLFPIYNFTLIPGRTLMFNSEGTNVIIDEQNFELFQDVLKQVFRIESSEGEDFNPVNDKAAEIAAKLKRGRKRVAAEKAKKGEGTNSIKQYLSIIPIAVNSMSVKDTMELTLYQLYALIERYSLYVSWDLDVRTRLAGGDPKQHPDNWMKNI